MLIFNQSVISFLSPDKIPFLEQLFINFIDFLFLKIFFLNFVTILIKLL